MVGNNRLYIVLLFLFFVTGCGKFSYRSSHYISSSEISLFIEMPESVNIFENINGILYRALYERFASRGFRIVAFPSNADFCLHTRVIKFDTSHKLISPDVIPFDFEIQCELKCSLEDVKKQRECSSHLFSFSQWFPRSLDVRYDSLFFTFEYKKFFDNNVPEIDYYFRRYMIARK